MNEDRTRTDLVIKETTDYDKFRKLLGNRDVSPQRVRNIKKSILRIGYQPVPILVNEKFEIIDGQGRMMACSELGLPILYTVKKGLTIEDCISMNVKMKNWSEIDYIKCYANRGDDNYIRLLDVISTYPTLARPTIYDVILGHSFGTGTDTPLIEGAFICPEITYDMHETLRWLTAIQKIIGKGNGSIIKILAKLNTLKLIDRQRMLESFEKYYEVKKIASRDSNGILAELNGLYNYNRKNVVYFADAYREGIRPFKNHRKEVTA